MDRARLIEATAGRTVQPANGSPLAATDVEHVLDALFGTVEHPGAIAEALRSGETVLCGSFGSFHSQDGTVSFRPGKALAEFLEGRIGR